MNTTQLKKFLLTFVTAAALALQWASNARAMDIEARPPFVILSGNVTGIELRILKDAIDSNPGITTVVLKNSRGCDARTGYVKYSDSKANPDLVEQWVNIENHNGFAYFYHPQASI